MSKHTASTFLPWISSQTSRMELAINHSDDYFESILEWTDIYLNQKGVLVQYFGHDSSVSGIDYNWSYLFQLGFSCLAEIEPTTFGSRIQLVCFGAGSPSELQRALPSACESAVERRWRVRVVWGGAAACGAGDAAVPAAPPAGSGHAWAAGAGRCGTPWPGDAGAERLPRSPARKLEWWLWWEQRDRQRERVLSLWKQKLWKQTRICFIINIYFKPKHTNPKWH